MNSSGGKGRLMLDSSSLWSNRNRARGQGGVDKGSVEREGVSADGLKDEVT